MISFVKKPARDISPAESEDNRFAQIRKAAAERRMKSDTDGTRRRARIKAEDAKRAETT